METITRERIREILRELGVDTSRTFETTLVIDPRSTKVTVNQWVKDADGVVVSERGILRSETLRYTIVYGDADETL